jgi:hypothetical protein
MRRLLLVLCMALCAPSWPADLPGSIVDLQPFRRATTASIVDAAGRRGTVTLIELNPNINAEFLVQLLWEDPSEIGTWQLENAAPRQTHIELSDKTRGLLIDTGHDTRECSLWPDRGLLPLEEARRSGLPYAPLCGGLLYLRNPIKGAATRLEQVTGFLRDHVWGGERIVNFVKEEFYRDHFAENSVTTAAGPVAGNRSEPAAASVAVSAAIVPEHLAIDVADIEHGLVLGAWYRVNDADGIYVSAIRPNAISGTILSSFNNRVADLDSVEANAVDYLVAFDLARFDFGFAPGTDHPRVDWSGRELPSMHDERLPGPDGIGTAAPLVRTAMVNPTLAARTAATFAAGFKREHGAFRYGDLAHRNHGSHYGFIEQGVVFSRLQPGLSTVYTLADGLVGLKTWTATDDLMLPRIQHARQNGVPLLERASDEGPGLPGPLVTQWGAGNWSGSADEKLRTLRAGLCVQSTDSHRFLIYGYFSTATPSAMVRVFQAYHCQYAMHLDMNALEHTYLALYTHRDGRLVVQHLIDGMSEVDRKGGAQLAPRFLGFPDDRDFFYLVRRPVGAGHLGLEHSQ